MLEKPIDLSPLTSLVIENTTVFADLVQNFYEYTEEAETLKIFDKSYKQLKKDELEIITDVLGYDINSAAMLRLIHKDLEGQISQDPALRTKIEDAIHNVGALINKELINFSLDLESEHMSLAGVLKAMNVRIEIDSHTIFDRVLDIVEVLKYLPKKRVIVFVNLGTFLTHAQMKIFAEHVALTNSHVLLLDNKPFEPAENQHILDSDYIVFSSYVV